MADITYDDIVADLIQRIRSEYGVNAPLTEETDVINLEEMDSLDVINYAFWLEETYGLNFGSEIDQAITEGALVIGKTAQEIIAL